MLNRDGLFAKRDIKPEDLARPTPTNPSYPPNQPGAQSANTVKLASLSDTSRPVAQTSAIDPKAAVASEGSKLIVGPNIKLKGVEISDCDVLIVEGHVEATVASRALHIAEPGTFNGQANIEEAEIQGEFTGDITARKRLIIKSTGRVSGKIRYGKLVIEDGGELSGDVKTTNGANSDAGISAAVASVSQRPPVIPAHH